MSNFYFHISSPGRKLFLSFWNVRASIKSFIGNFNFKEFLGLNKGMKKDKKTKKKKIKRIKKNKS
jgi:hypothetical protein